MALSLKIKIPGLSLSSNSADISLVYFITYIFALSTAEISPSELLKTGGVSGYGRYSKLFTDIHNLGVKWQYGIASAAGIVASQLKQADEFRLFLMKMEQVVRLGDSMKEFLSGEMGAVIHAYSAAYERSMESLKLLLGMFSTLMSTSSFMIAALMIMSMIGGLSSDSSMIIMVTVAVIGGLSSFALMMYMMFPRDPLVDERGPHVAKVKKVVYVALAGSAGIGVVLALTDIVPTGIALCAAGGPLMLPGYLARKVEGKARRVEEGYPSFIRHLTEVYATVGSLGQALKAVLKSDFGEVTVNVRRMLNRVLNRVTIEDSFDLFSIDTGNTTITSGNKIVSGSIIKGANMAEVGEILANLLSKLNELKKKRQQTAKAVETTLIILHVLTLAVLSFMGQVFQLFTDIFSQVDASVSGSVVIQPISGDVMNLILTIMIVALSGINGVVIKVAQGGLFKTMWFNIGLLMIIGGIVSFGIEMFASQMFDTMLAANPLADTLP